MGFRLSGFFVYPIPSCSFGSFFIIVYPPPAVAEV